MPAAFSATAATRPVVIDTRQVLTIAVPMTLAHLSTPLLGLTHTLVIGRLDNPAYLGAVSIGAILFDFVFWSFGFLRMGTAGLTAQALGAGDKAEQRALLLRALLLAVGLGGALILMQTLIARLVLPLFGGSDAVMAAARLYFDIRIWSAPLTFANYAFLGWLIGIGRPNLGLALQMGMTIFNIVLCLWFSFAWDYAVAGVAWAGVITEAAGVLVGLAITADGFGRRLGLSRQTIFDRVKFLRMIAVNRDIMLRTMMLMIVWSFFSRQGAKAGDVILAANAVLLNLFAIGGYFVDGIATAAEQLCGRAVGANNRAAFMKAVRLSCLWNVVLAGLLSLILYFSGGPFIKAMVANREVQAAADIYLIYAALSPLAGVLAFTFDGIFVGATWNVAMRNLMAVAIGFYFLVWWLAQPLGNHGLWLAILAFLVLRGINQALVYAWLMRRPARA